MNYAWDDAFLLSRRRETCALGPHCMGLATTLGSRRSESKYPESRLSWVYRLSIRHDCRVESLDEAGQQRVDTFFIHFTLLRALAKTEIVREQALIPKDDLCQAFPANALAALLDTLAAQQRPDLPKHLALQDPHLAVVLTYTDRHTDGGFVRVRP